MPSACPRYSTAYTSGAADKAKAEALLLLLSVFPGFFFFFQDLLQRLSRKGGEKDLITSAGLDL